MDADRFNSMEIFNLKDDAFGESIDAVQDRVRDRDSHHRVQASVTLCTGQNTEESTEQTTEQTELRCEAAQMWRPSCTTPNAPLIWSCYERLRARLTCSEHNAATI